MLQQQHCSWLIPVGTSCSLRAAIILIPEFYDPDWAAVTPAAASQGLCSGCAVRERECVEQQSKSKASLDNNGVAQLVANKIRTTISAQAELSSQLQQLRWSLATI
jgi:hypothetical protein